MGKKINEIKAPMPGLVLRIPINEGDSVSKGEGLLVLEAMKMENIIKSPGDVVVSKILVKPGQAVEKNQLLVSFA
jgi:biotin carboxyl carrier protein